MSNCRFELLQKYLNSTPQHDYPYRSRIGSLNSYSDTDVCCYVKRDDELGFGISGSKIRKYRTLIPYIINNGFEEVIVIGSAFSNHVLGVSQLLIENRIKAMFFLKGDPERAQIGNALLSSLFIPREKIRRFSNADWKNVNVEAQEYAALQPHSTYIIPEGGSSYAALPGALTLPVDILRNEKESDLCFDHIFIDSGTGLTACALILGLNLLEHGSMVHVVLMAEDHVAFKNKLRTYSEMLNSSLDEEISFPENFNSYLPALKKFGQVNQTIFRFISDFARSEGILTDPIYSAKLFMEAKKIIKEKNLSGKILIVHSGGAITLSGFSDRLFP